MKKNHIIIIVLIAVSIGAIMGTLADSSTYANFSTAFNNQGREYHVVGKADKSKAFVYEPEKNANLFSFYLTDNEGIEKWVMYKGPKPQDFEMSEQIVITGEAKDTVFMADKILMKCPSKYKNTEEPVLQ
jgi:cytochrome c-type biogenesis protein CcmE